ncbi:MAG: hypothetical protein AAGJ93_08665, partial [Bacteroidota bacterium]
MKFSIVFTLLFLAAFHLSAQGKSDYTELSDTAWELYSAEKYEEATALYNRLVLEYKTDRGENYYMAACCSALAGKLDAGLEYTQKSVDFGFWKQLDLYKTDPDLDTLRQLPGWKGIIENVNTKVTEQVEVLKNRAKLFTRDKFGKDRMDVLIMKLDQLNETEGEELIRVLSKMSVYPDYQTDTTTHLCFWLEYKDSLEVPFLVQLPAGFSNNRPHPLFFQLHGGVRHIEEYPAWLDESNAAGWNRYFSEQADSTGMIMVYPYATKRHNWMTTDDGFDLIPKIIRQLKLMFNIDENRVYLSGHSNGATGSFSYAIKNQTLFARFFGLNTHPQVYTGGTFIRNLTNTHFHNVSTDMDYYYPQTGIDSLLILSKKYDLGFSNDLYLGFPHWFPEFDESEPAIAEFFKQARSHSRNPFSKDLYWECDNLDNNRVHWLEILELDTLQSPAFWHKNINYTVSNWVDVDDETQTIPDYSEMAFKYPRRSAAV